MKAWVMLILILLHRIHYYLELLVSHESELVSLQSSVVVTF